jgi:hypothetical protein
MGRDKDGHPVAARELDHQAPEIVARDRVDARGRFVEDQQLGLVHHGDGEREALAVAERQFLGQQIQRVLQAKALCHLGGAARDLRLGHMEQARVQQQVLLHRQFAIEREPCDM